MHSDAETLADLIGELNRYHAVDLRPDAALLQRDWGCFEAFFAVQDNEILGFLSGFEMYQLHTGTKRFEIQNLYVRQLYRRHGIGRMLIEQTVLLKHSQGIENFVLGALETNAQAMTFYESIGFTQRPRDNFRYILSGKLPAR